MKDVLVQMEIVRWLAKDMHYRSYDEWFYALHLLADKIDFGNSDDDLKEAYYLGMKGQLPPTEEELHAIAVSKVGPTGAKSNLELIEALHDACDYGMYLVEEAKKENGLFAGVHAILDGISQTMLVAKGLCWRSLTHAGTGDSE